MNALASAFVAAVAAWLLLNGLLYIAQPGMLFHPTGALAATPRDWGLDYRDLTLVADDGVRLHAWLVPRKDARRTLLFFHGNAGNISHRGDSVGIFHRLGLNVLILDYRGYGRSEGQPSEAGLYRDARAAWDWLMGEGLAPGDVVLFGRSLGATVAARLAWELGPAAQPGGLILESGFSSARAAARAIFPLLSRLIVLQRYELDAATALRQVRSPVLVLHSPEDEIVPYGLGRKLYDAANEPKRFVDLRGDHNAGFLLSQPDYARALGDFFIALAEQERGAKSTLDSRED